MSHSVVIGVDNLPLNVFNPPILAQLLAELAFVYHVTDATGFAPAGWRETFAEQEATIKAWIAKREAGPYTGTPILCEGVERLYKECHNTATHLVILHTFLNNTPGSIYGVCAIHLRRINRQHDLDITITL